MPRGVDVRTVPHSAPTPGPPPTVAAVVVAYESADTIGPCVTELLRIPGLTGVVVVDHGSDGAGQVAERLGAVVVHDPSNPGFGAGQNRGLALTHAPFVLLCNPDAVVIPDAVASGLATLAAQPDLAALQGVIEERDRELDQRSSWQSVGASHLWARILRIGPLLRTPPLRALSARLTPHAPAAAHDVEALAAIVLLTRRQALEEIGGFDASYFLYWEDLDLSKRLRDAGWRLQVTPDRWAVHVGGASSSDPFARERQWWRGCMRYAALWYPPTGWWAALGAATVQWLTMSIRRPSQSGALRTDLLRTPWRTRRRRRRSTP